VGALCSKDFLYKQRVWFLKEERSVCPDCSTGCSVYVDQNKNIVYRLRPRANPQAQGYFLCDEGRFDFAYINAPDRISEPLVHGDKGQTVTPWEFVLPALRRALEESMHKQAGAVGVVLSPFLTCEEAFLLARYFKDQDTAARLYLGRVPVRGEDDTYPKDRKGRPVQPVKFTIRGEKCPNRRGVEEVLRHFQGEVLSFDEMLRAAGAGEFQALYLTAGYSPNAGEWITPEQISLLAKTPLLVVQDLFPSALTTAAHYVLPAVSFAEKSGTFINHANLAQELRRAVAPPNISRIDGQIFAELSQRRGLYHAATVRKELAAAVPFFAPLAEGVLGEYGINLGEGP
jgi:NADH-quinone oxidoreductase subunit G